MLSTHLYTYIYSVERVEISTEVGSPWIKIEVNFTYAKLRIHTDQKKCDCKELYAHNDPPICFLMGLFCYSNNNSEWQQRHHQPTIR